MDYQFTNNTDSTFQLIVYTTDEYLCGELRADKEQQHNFHIIEKDSYFEEIDGKWYRNNKIYRRIVDKTTGNEISKVLIIQNHAKVLYNSEFINKDMIK